MSNFLHQSHSFFSVVNMGHKQLKKCSKYKLVIFLDEKRRFSFANFLHLLIQVPSLTHSALLWDYLGTSWGLPWDYLATIRRPPVEYFFASWGGPVDYLGATWWPLWNQWEATQWLLIIFSFVIVPIFLQKMYFGPDLFLICWLLSKCFRKLWWRMLSQQKTQRMHHLSKLDNR